MRGEKGDYKFEELMHGAKADQLSFRGAKAEAVSRHRRGEIRLKGSNLKYKRELCGRRVVNKGLDVVSIEMTTFQMFSKQGRNECRQCKASKM